MSGTMIEGRPSHKPILCLDFDGVVHSYTTRYTGPLDVNDPPTPGFFRFLCEAQDAGYSIHIFSSRSGHAGGIDAMRRWLWKWAATKEDGLPEDEWLRIDAIQFPLTKPPAMITLDDRALTFTGIWPAIEQLKSFRPWNKKETQE